MDKVDSMEEQWLGNVNREMEIVRKKKKKEMLDKDQTEMKNAFDEPINRLDSAEERISEEDDTTIESSETEKQREKN